MDLKAELLKLGEQALQDPKVQKSLGIFDKVKDLKGDLQKDTIDVIIGEYIPTIKVFKIKGRLYDKQTKDPIQGAKVNIQGGLRPMVVVEKTKKVKINKPNIFSNTVIKEGDGFSSEIYTVGVGMDPDKNPTNPEDLTFIYEKSDGEGNFFTFTAFQGGSLAGQAEINENDKIRNANFLEKLKYIRLIKKESGYIAGSNKPEFEEVTVKEYEWDKDTEPPKIQTNDKGEFEIEFGTVVIPALKDKVLLDPYLIYEKDNYVPTFQAILDSKRQVLQDLPIKELINIDEAAEIAKQEIVDGINKQVDKAANIVLDSLEKSIIILQDKVLSFAKVVQNRLFPLAISLLILFGVAKITKKELLRAKCPNDAVLRSIIKKRNSVVRQLNQIYGVIIANTALAALFLYLSKQFAAGKIAVSNIPLPLGSPLGVGQPYSVVSKLERIQELLDELGETNKKLRKALIIALIFLIISLILILLYLKKIDGLINNCSKDIPMEQINAELLALTEGSELDGNEIKRVVNGFILGTEVVYEDNSDLYRRRATATNSQGVIMLRGEPSFSAEDQILIDELAFYIQQNNLKA